MTIDNFAQFVELVYKYNLEHTGDLVRYYNDYSKICNCKPTLKNLYFEKTEKLYVNYVNSHSEHIKQKIGTNVPIIMFKTYGKIFCTLQLN